MHRCAFLLCALAALAASGAPAPLGRAWLGIDGWRAPLDPAGDCRFDRDGARLTITVPGKGHDFDVAAGRLNAARLLRDVEGDFVVRVRVGGAFRPTGKTGRQRAGLLLTDGTRFLKVQRVAAPLAVLDSQPVEPLCLEWSVVDGAQVFFFENKPALEERAYLRIQRRGRSLLPVFSEDGRKWTRMRTSLPRLMDGIRLSGKVKVGVFAESTAEGVMKVVFDRFELTAPSKP
jgi:regulation of enolase protein 1 (concanavalin A-like superfamily)